MLVNAIKEKRKNLKENSHYGNPISKKLIPKEYGLKQKIYKFGDSSLK